MVPSVAHICPQMGPLTAVVVMPQVHACTCPHSGPLVVVTQVCPRLLVVAASFVAPALACVRLHTCTLVVAAAPQAYTCTCPWMGLLVAVTQACLGLLVAVVAAVVAAGACSTLHA